jgi:hypothetical protein
VSVEPKPFQLASIEAAMRAFTASDHPRRFLVADEAGLGKTIVASGIVERMSKGRRVPLRVFYVCSNLAIAAQNLSRLVSFLSEDNLGSAVAKVDRPSLMPTKEMPTHERVQVFSLTPDTAIPMRHNRQRGGRLEERAFGQVLLDEILPSNIPGLHRALRLNVKPERFTVWVQYYRGLIRRGEIATGGFRTIFRDALRTEMGVEPGQQLPSRIRELIEQGEGLTFVAKLRSALAVAALEQVRPDLVIFDEFQRFRDLVDEAPDTNDAVEMVGSDADPTSALDEAAPRVLRAIRGDGTHHRPALLLLSATPYLPYRGREEVGVYTDPAKDFFTIVEFLFGGGFLGQEATSRARRLFSVLGEELRKGSPLSNRAQTARAQLRSLLSQVMSRTERPRSKSDGLETEEGNGVFEARLLPGDIHAFKHLKECLSEDDYGWAVPLWQSVPLAMQALGTRYKVWRRARPVPPPPDIALTPDNRRRLLTNGPWPHPRLRKLLEVMPLSRVALPWIAPSLPWWPLDGDWKGIGSAGTVDGKLLVFSRFRAVPVALSALISFSVEARALKGRRPGAELNYEAVTRRQFLNADPDRPALLMLFHPSPLLSQLNPLTRNRGTLNGAKASIQRQLRKLLSHLGVEVVSRIHRERRRPWELLAMLERRAGLWPKSRAAWHSVADSLKGSSGHEVGTRLRAMLVRWDQKATEEISEIDDDGEFKPLVDLALDSPGVVLARALQRHWPEVMLTSDNLGDLAGLCWRGLRSYFDAPWFAAALADGRDEFFPDAIRRSVVQGNLEAVLDEHFWFLAKAGGENWKERLNELESALRLRASNVVLHEKGPGSEPMRIRCHAAIPLNEVRAGSSGSGDAVPALDLDVAQEDRPLRPDEVRRAFNTPFWPHVLVTTSIGQEGLDFHPWCRALAHWDLCSGPVALEQREGRINRFAGLSVRRAIVNEVGKSPWEKTAAESPWKRLEASAQVALSDSTGLSPWWVVPGGTTQKLFLSVPGSEQLARRDALETERMLYRLVLGMSDQVDLLELIASREKWDVSTIREASLDLSASGAS